MIKTFSMSSSITESSGAHPDERAPKQVSRFTRWYRSPLFNVIVVGLISFTQPGIWNALNSTFPDKRLDCKAVTVSDVGAGGQQEPYLVNGANSLTFGIMVFGCSLFAILANKFGLKNVLILGTLGYAPYSASLYGKTIPCIAEEVRQLKTVQSTIDMVRNGLFCSEVLLAGSQRQLFGPLKEPSPSDMQMCTTEGSSQASGSVYVSLVS